MKRQKYSSNEHIDAHVKEMLKRGCTFKKGRKHGKLVSPDGTKQVSIPGTPSDWRAPRQFAAQLRRRFRGG